VRLTDEQIERYSRQLILQELGPRGQERLLASRVAVALTGVAAERVVAHLAAAGVGWIAADPGLHGLVDPAQPDCAVVALADDARDLGVAVVGAGDAGRWKTRARTVVWIADGSVGALPARPPAARPAAAASEPAGVRDALLGTVAATEVVKALLAIGTPLAGRVFTYDPATATVTTLDLA
jgi:hypothetical protein